MASILTTPPDIKYSEPAAETDFAAFKTVVESRRSVRVFTKDPIPEAVVRECLRLALLAPTSSNLQCWEFHWVRDPKKKAELAKTCFSQSAARTAAELIVCVARTKTWRANNQRMLDWIDRQDNPPKSLRDYYGKLTKIVYNQGPLGLFGPIKKIGLFFTGLVRPVPREPNSLNDMKVWAVKTTALACENLMLAFRAAGFDSCPMEGFDSTRVKKLLSLPRDANVVMVVGAGKRDAKGVYGPRIRFDESLFIREV